MSSHGLETGFNDTMHITLSMLFSVLVVAMIALSAAAYRGWFRVYALATMVVVVGFGAASGVAMSGVEQDDTPWVGGFERINAYAYFAWLVVLAATVIRKELDASSGTRESGDSAAACANRCLMAPRSDTLIDGGDRCATSSTNVSMSDQGRRTVRGPPVSGAWSTVASDRRTAGAG